MKKEKRLPIDSPWFINAVVPIISGLLGAGPSIHWLLEASDDPVWFGMGIGFTPFCAVTGFLLFRIATWLAPIEFEDSDA